MILVLNPGYRKYGHVWVNYKFIKQVNMFDEVLIETDKGLAEGYVAAITRRGVNVNRGIGDRFCKWCHIYAVKKEELPSGKLQGQIRERENEMGCTHEADQSPD